MARSRNIKPAFYKNEYLAQVSAHARLLYIGLWCMADVKGRMEYRPARIRAELFPYESVNIESLMAELSSSPERFIIIYEVDGCQYLEIPNFHKHQNPHPNEKKTGSRIPAPGEGFEESRLQVGYSSVTSNLPVGDLQPTSRADSLLLIPDSLTLITDRSVSNETSPIGDCVSGNGLKKETDRLAMEGMAYLASLESPNHMNNGWIKGYLGIELPAMAGSRPDLSLANIMGAWRDTCDLAVQKNKPYPNWFKSTFKNKVAVMTPEAPKTSFPDRPSGQAEALLSFPFIRHIVTEETFPSDTLEVRPENPNGLYAKQGGAYFPAGQLKGITEEVPHVGG